MVDADRPAQGIEITVAMEEAGVEAFLESYPDTGAGDFQDRRMVREIFVAMANARAGSSKAAPAG
jgi:hypothetical protein